MDAIGPEEHPALGRLSDRNLLRDRGFIDGGWRSAEAAVTFPVRDPASAVDVAQVAALGAAEAAQATAAAARAFPGWRTTPAEARARRLRDWCARIVASRGDLALLLTLEQGKPLAESRSEVDYAASFVAWFAEEAMRIGAETVTSHLPDAQSLVTRSALGVAALITPWNFPSAMLTRKAAAAIAAGCTVVAHPSAFTPLSALALAELADRAGFPRGVFNVVPGAAEPIVRQLCADPCVRVVSFTGSTAVGRVVAAQCAPTMKRTIMELGGNAPLIVFDDADLERAVEIAVDAKFATSGQDCLAANRIFVQTGLYCAFCDVLAARIVALRVGPGLDADTQVGPLMHMAAVARTHDRITDALARGARRLTPDRPAPGPLFVMPTLLADVPDDAAIMREESFAPIACVARFETESEVITRANDTEYGLMAYVVTRDGARALRMSRSLEFGMVAINRARTTGAPIPFGGI